MSEVKPTNAWSGNNGIGAGDRLKKKLYRWRRLLANLDPLIQYVVAHTRGTGPLENFHHVVLKSWMPYVMAFWCHTHIDQLVSMTGTYAENFSMPKFWINYLFSSFMLASSSVPKSKLIRKTLS
jgi:hypothetical protein